MAHILESYLRPFLKAFFVYNYVITLLLALVKHEC